MAARPPPGARRLVSFGLLMWSAALARAIPFEAGALSKADTNDFSLQPAGDQPSLDFERATIRCNKQGKYGKKACCTNFLVPQVAMASKNVCKDKKFVADANENCHQFFYYNSARAAPPTPTYHRRRCRPITSHVAQVR